MVVKPSVKVRCKHCKLIHRHGSLRVICSKEQRHKQRQG